MSNILFTAIFCVAGAFLLGSMLLQAIVLVPRSRRFRTDLAPGEHVGKGSSRFWQVNVYNSANYRSPEGQAFFRKLRGAAIVQLASILVLLVLALFAMD
jgi:hypothetical protein